MAGRSSATAAVGQPAVEIARRRRDQIIVISLAGGTAGELDGSRKCSFDHEGIRPRAGEHHERTTIRSEKWVRETVEDLDLEQTTRPEGRVRKASQSATEATG